MVNTPKDGKLAELSRHAKVAAVIFAYLPTELSNVMLECIMESACDGFGEHAQRAIKELLEKGFIERKGNGKVYRNIASYTADGFTRMMDDAAAAGILKMSAFMAARNVGNMKAVSMTLLLQIAKGVRFLIGGGANEALRRDFDDEMSGYNSKDFKRGVAFWAAKTIEDEPDFDFEGRSAPLLGIVPFWLNARFLRSGCIRKTLDALEVSISKAQRCNTRLWTAFISGCFWCGKKSGLDAIALDKLDLEKASGKVMANLLGGAKCAMAGDFASAEISFKTVTKYSEPPFASGGDYERGVAVDNVMQSLMMATCSAVAKPDKLPKSRPVSLMRPTFVVNRPSYSPTVPHGTYLCNVVESAEIFSANWVAAISGRADVLNNPTIQSDYTPTGILICAWAYRMLVRGRQKFDREAKGLIRFAKWFYAEGYVNFAGLMLSLVAGFFYKGNVPAEIREIQSAALGFLPEPDAQAEWKLLLQKLAKSAASAEKSAMRDEECVRDSIVWHLRTYGDDAYGKVDLSSLRPARRRAGAPANGSADEEISLEWGFERSAVRKLFEGRDLVLASALRNVYSAQSDEMSRVFPLLVGMDNIYVVEEENDYSNTYYYRRKLKNLKPVKVVSRTCEMKTSMTADGGISLSVPDWALDTKNEFVPVWGDDSTIEVVQITKAAQKLIKLFLEFGSDGEIKIPAAGVAEASPVLQSIAKILPPAAPTEEEKVNLARVAASSALTIRLDFAGMILKMQMLVKPVAAMPHLIVSPGEGHAERVVNDATGTYLLVRDIAAEKERLDAVKAALVEFEGWYDGKSTWEMEGIAAALAALDAVKTLSETRKEDFVMEWFSANKLSVTRAPKSGVSLKSSRTAEDWFRVDGEWKLDDGRVLSIAKMLEAAKERLGDYVRLSDGDFIRLTKAMARQLSALAAAGRRKGDGVEVSKAAIPMLDNAFDGKDDSLVLPDAMAATADEIRKEFARRPALPRALNAELRPYQVDGFKWLSRLAGCAFGACLADDMGLGKTLQIIALLLERAKDGVSLVVAPSSVCGNWRSEIGRFAPSLRPRMAYEEMEGGKFGAFDVVIASYNYVLFHEDEFAKTAWNGVVLDEAQAIKNDASKRAKAVKRMPSKFRIAATGTPVENRLGELWSIFDFLNPGLLGAASSFASRFTQSGMATPEMKRLVKPLILRRLKGDVLDDLPEKTETTIRIELGKAEREAYEGCRLYALSQLEKAADDGDDGPNRISILAQLTRLRRFCCHPSLVLPDEHLPSAKMEALVELLANLRESSHRALVFSQFTDYLAIVRKTIAAHGWSHLYLDGTTPTAERERLVNAFQSGEGDFFVISLKAGGTGLNLTAADYVILLDPWWNPAVENQAADRAHRIGQKNPVTVYRLIASDTVEERVIELHKEKKEIAEDVLDATGSSSLSQAQLMSLFRK